MAVLTTGIVGAGLGWVLRYMIEGGEAADTGFETKAALLEAIQQMATPGKQGWLPKNHVFEKAVRECLRAAFLFAGYATSEELGEKKSYWEVLVESVRTGDFAKVPLTELRDTDERLWLAAYLERAKDKSSFAESSDADLPFEPERWIDLWSPDEDEEQAAELQEWLREWLESVIQKHGPIPQAFRVGLVEGFRPGSKLEGGRVQRVSLHAAFCLFLREKYRNNPPAYRQGVAETLRRIRDRQDEGQQEIIARLDALQEALPDADTLTDLVGEVIEGKFLGVTRRFDELSTKVLTLTQLFIDGQLRTDLTFGQLRRAFDALFAKMEESNRLLQEQGKKLDNLEGQTIEPDYDAALRRIAAEHPCTSDELKSILTTFSKRVKENPQPDHLDLAKAAYADKHFDEAATQADNAYEKAMERREKAMEQKAESEQAISDATENAIEAASFEAQVHFEQVEFEKALACRRRSAALVGIDEDPIGWAVAQLEVAFILHELARHAEAEPLMRRVVEIFEKSHGEEHPQVAVALNNLGQLLQETNRHVEAEPLMKRVVEIFEKSHGEEHPQVAVALNNLGLLLKETNRHEEAEPLMKRALSIDESSYGPEHPTVARDLNNLGQLLKETNRHVEAEPLMERALSIDESSYGPEHPTVAIRLNNLGQLLQATNRHVEAEPLMNRVVRILLLFTKRTGHEHPHLRVVIGNYASLLQEMGRSEEDILAALAKVKREAGNPPEAE